MLFIKKSRPVRKKFMRGNDQVAISSLVMNSQASENDLLFREGSVLTSSFPKALGKQQLFSRTCFH